MRKCPGRFLRYFPLTFHGRDRVCLVKHAPTTYTWNSVGSEDASLSQAMATHPLAADEGWTMESIDRRANYVGPVLEGIMREMEEHWRRNHDVEL